ncbi:uncharacterized protein LOC129339799 [Eublepharis macularius]|uniref:Uncharacterized protein LOC129339799 n=1 Tax=Eublepharis macularius TaxID=481883 RepID=A0AA97LCJ0_EUBMA|nr:uncharacterized protein LOC129339799 [Eublepharis macularius]
MEISHWAILSLSSLFISGVRCQVQLNQSLLEIAKEGENSTIACKYDSVVYNVQWYRQFPGERPTHLLTIAGKEASEEPNFRAEHNKQEQSSRLRITEVQLSDAATYFCAVEAQRGVSGQESVSQDPSSLAKEGEPVQLNCSYSGTANSFQWFKQSPGGQIQSMAMVFGRVCKSESEVTQLPAKENIWEGDPFALTCNFPVDYSTFFWYLQLPGSAPSLLLSVGSTENNTDGRFTAERLEKGRQSRLHLSSSQLRDSGTYLCAARAQ